MDKHDFTLIEIELVNELDKIIDHNKFKFTGDGEIGIVDKQNPDYFLDISDIELSDAVKPVAITFTYDRFPHQRDYDDYGSKSKVSISQLKEVYDSWYELILEYEKAELPPSFLGAVHADQQKFYDQVKFTDEAADYEAFKWQEAIVIDEYLEKSIKLLDAYEEKTGNDVYALKELAQDIKDNQGKLSKNGVMLKLSELWARTKSESTALLKEIFVHGAKTIMGEVVKGLLG